MALINRDLPAPDVWPPLRAGEAIRAAVRYARERDPVGHRVHIALACLYAAMLPLSTGPKDIAFILLVGYALIRLPNTWRAYPAVLRWALVWATIGWTIWQGITILWSADPGEGLSSLRAFRVILTPLALWPVLDAVVLMIGSFLIGVFAANVIQLSQGLELFGLKPADDERLRSAIHPIQFGTMCIAAICWHLAALLRGGRAWWRATPWWGALTVIGLGAATLGLIFTGSRGPWIAAAITIPLMLIVTLLRRPGSRRATGAVLIVGIVGTVIAWPLVSGMVVTRYQQAVDELNQAIEGDAYATSTGLRIKLWSWAIDAWQTNPVFGIGAGGYRSAQYEHPEFQRLIAEHPEDEDYLARHHAHQTYLHVLCCTGLIGAGFMLAVLALVIWRAWRDPADHLYADGTLFALVGWLVGANFDAYHLNGHLFGLFWFIAALTLADRLPARWKGG